MQIVKKFHCKFFFQSGLSGPHLTLKYSENDSSVVNDVNKLLLFCLEKADNMRRGERRKIKVSSISAMVFNHHDRTPKSLKTGTIKNKHKFWTWLKKISETFEAISYGLF